MFAPASPQSPFYSSGSSHSSHSAIGPVLCFGSLNIDHVYQMAHIVRPGETTAAHNYAIYAGGKGLNQSLALARAGLDVFHAGRLGREGLWLRDVLADEGIDCRHIECCAEEHTGHAIIQVGQDGQNSIVLYGGANQNWNAAAIDNLFAPCQKSWRAIICQNEMNGLEHLFDAAKKREIPLIFNAAPYSPDLKKLELGGLHTLLVNETEAMGLAETECIPAAFSALQSRYPDVRLVMTLGAEGLWASYQGRDYKLPALRVPPVDTTAAGDTFAGYYAASVLGQQSFEAALHWGNRAAALAVGRAGAAPSVPYIHELS